MNQYEILLHLYLFGVLLSFVGVQKTITRPHNRNKFTAPLRVHFIAGLSIAAIWPVIFVVLIAHKLLTPSHRRTS